MFNIYLFVCLYFVIIIIVPKVTDLNVDLMYKNVLQRDKEWEPGGSNN